MIPRFFCWLLGHDYVLKGKNKIEHCTRMPDGTVVHNTDKDHFLFCCHRCKEFKEYECKYNYQYLDLDSNQEKYEETSHG